MSRAVLSRKTSYSVGRKLSIEKRAQQHKQPNSVDAKEKKKEEENTHAEKVARGIFGDVPLTDTERRLLSSALLGNLNAIQQCVEENGTRNLNCRDYLGRTALQLAVIGEHYDAIQFLLDRSSLAVIEEGLLHAIKSENVKICDMFLSHPIYSDKKARMQLEFEHGFYDQEENSSSFASDITPIVLAAQCNNFDIVHMLIQKGFNIQTPHHYFCLCTECTNHKMFDRFVHSRSRLNAYMGLASTAYLSLSSDDPIAKAFELSRLLETLADTEKEYKSEYKGLSETCKTYAVDLLDLCRSNDEVLAVLHGGFDIRDLSRIKKAIRYEQKKFIAHASTQEHLMSMWYAGAPWFQHQPFMAKLFLAPLGIMFIPVTAIVYVFLPYSKIGEVLKSPFIKFMNYICSYTAFLVLLFVATILTSVNKNVNMFAGTEGVVNSLIMFFVAGMFWAECKQLFEEGIRDYFSQMWNYMDITMLALYTASYAIEGVIYTKARHLRSDYLLVAPSDSKIPNPQILAKVLFSMANVMSFARIAYILPASETFGQLQISYGRMLQDVGKFIFIYFTVMIAFICGLTSLYSLSKNENFSNLMQTTGTLFWAAFGMGNSEAPKISEGGSHNLVEFVGFVLYGLYILGAVVVLINMLIAMMSNTFEEIQVCEDIEWKFARAKLWISFVEEGTTLPIPFNIIPTPKSIFRLFVFMKQHNSKQGEGVDPDRPDGGFATDYKAIMHKVVLRYVHRMKFDKKGDSLRDDISEAKDDILKQLNSVYHKLSSRMDTLERDVCRFQTSFVNKDEFPSTHRLVAEVQSSPVQFSTEASSQPQNHREKADTRYIERMRGSPSMRRTGSKSRELATIRQIPESPPHQKRNNQSTVGSRRLEGSPPQKRHNECVVSSRMQENKGQLPHQTTNIQLQRTGSERGSPMYRDRKELVHTRSPSLDHYSHGRRGEQAERGRSVIRTLPSHTLSRRTPSLERSRGVQEGEGEGQEWSLIDRASNERGHLLMQSYKSNQTLIRRPSTPDRIHQPVGQSQSHARVQITGQAYNIRRTPSLERISPAHDQFSTATESHSETRVASEGYEAREMTHPRDEYDLEQVCSHVRAQPLTRQLSRSLSPRGPVLKDV